MEVSSIKERKAMVHDPFKDLTNRPDIAKSIQTVTPADEDVAVTIKQIRVGSVDVGTDLTVQGPNREDIVFKNVRAGEVIPGPFYQIKATGTTVSDIVGWL